MAICWELDNGLFLLPPDTVAVICLVWGFSSMKDHEFMLKQVV